MEVLKECTHFIFDMLRYEQRKQLSKVLYNDYTKGENK